MCCERKVRRSGVRCCSKAGYDGLRPGGLGGGCGKGNIGSGVRYGCGASGRGIHRGVMGKIREAGLGKAWGAKMAAVEPAPEAKACEVGRIVD